MAILTVLIVFANAIALFGPFDDDPAIFLNGLSIITQRGPWFGIPNWYDPNIGFTLQALGHLAAQDWLHGSLPWWNPYAGVGMPLAAELQNEALFFPFVLLLHFHAGWIYLRMLMQIFSAVFCYLLLVELKLSRLSALLAGMMYGCSASFILLADAPAATFPFIPLLLLGIERSRSAAIKSAPMGWSAVTISVAYSFYAGFPETGLLGDLFGGVWFAARLAGLRRDQALIYLGKFGLAIGIGGALTLPGLLPFIEYVYLGTLGAHTEYFATAHLGPLSLAEQILPFIFGPVGISAGFKDLQNNPLMQGLDESLRNCGGWFGALPIMLALLALAPKRRLTTLRWTICLWLVFWEARSFGVPGMANLVNIIHPLSLIEVFRYAQPSCDFIIILLAAFAVDDWQRGALSRTTRWFCAILMGVLCGISIIIALPTEIFLNNHFPNYMFIVLFYLFTISAFVFALFKILDKRPDHKRRFALALLLTGDALLGFSLSQAAGIKKSTTDTSAISFLTRNIGLARAYTLGPLSPNYGAYFGINEINHNYLPVPKLWTDFLTTQLDDGADSIVFNGDNTIRTNRMRTPSQELKAHIANYQAIGVKYILSPPLLEPFANMPAGSAPLLVLQSPVMKIYQLSTPAPYMRLANTSCTLTIDSRTSAREDCKTPTVITRQELFYPGWHAMVNGASAKIFRAGIFQSLSLPAGASKIEFFYRPTGERAAGWTAMSALMVWLLCAGRVLPRRKVLHATRSSDKWLAP